MSYTEESLESKYTGVEYNSKTESNGENGLNIVAAIFL